MARRRPDSRPTPAAAAQIDAVLALDVARENALLRERALELLEECESDPPGTRCAARELELTTLVDAFEGMPPPPAAASAGREVGARTNREIAAACRELVARLDALRSRHAAD